MQDSPHSRLGATTRVPVEAVLNSRSAVAGAPDAGQPDKYMRAADQRSGAYSILTGVAANLSIGSGNEIRISDLVQGIGYPDYPKMPSENQPVPMSRKS